MEPAEREDLLLAVSRIEARSGRKPVAGDLAVLLERNLPDVQMSIEELVSRGELEISDDGVVSLTSAGCIAAEAVMKKHKVLETFFEEMLGMDRTAAHQQACTLEHHASEETISRLSDLICSKPPCFTGRIFMGEHPDPSCEYRVLTDCSEGDRIRVVAVTGCGRASRLADLGIIAGEEMVIRRRMAKTLLVQVKGTDIAISADIASHVLVESC